MKTILAVDRPLVASNKATASDICASNCRSPFQVGLYHQDNSPAEDRSCNPCSPLEPSSFSESPPTSCAILGHHSAQQATTYHNITHCLRCTHRKAAAATVSIQAPAAVAQIRTK